MDISTRRDLGEGEEQQTQLHPETTFTETSSPNLDWRTCLRRLAKIWHQAELVLVQHFPAHGNLLFSSRDASGTEPTEPELSRMEKAAECWKKSPNAQTCLATTTRVLIDAISDVEHTAAAVGELIIPCTQGGTLVGKGGILHILTALGNALNCADCERSDTEFVGLSGVEEAVKNFETERYLADDWERDEALMETTRRVKNILEGVQEDVLFSNLVAGCRAHCTDYRQAKWVVVRALTESSIPVRGDIQTTSLIFAMRSSRFGNHGLASSPAMQYHVTVDVPLSADEIATLIPWLQLTNAGQVWCGSRIAGWYVKWSRTVLHRGYLYPEYSAGSQEEARAILMSSRTWIRFYPTYIRKRTSLSVDVVCKIGWFVLNAPSLLQELYKEVAEGSGIPDGKRLGMHVMDRLREWNLYEAIGEQGVTERSVSHLVINTENVDNWVRHVVKRCLRSVGDGGVTLISSNGNTLYCTSGGAPMVDGQEKMPGNGGFFLRKELQNDATRVMTKQGILEAFAPHASQRSADEIRHLLTGIHAVCDQICGNLVIKPDFSALQDLGDFSYRRNVSLQLVPGAYSFGQGALDEEEAMELRRHWQWASVPDSYLAVDREGIAVD